MKTDNLNWDELLDFITSGSVVPVIGSDLIRLEEGHQLLYDRLAQTLAEILKVPDPKTEDLTFLEFIEKYGSASGNIKRAIKNAYEKIAPQEFRTTCLENLAKIEDFDFYISTSFDTMLEDTLQTYRCQNGEKVNVLNYSIRDFVRSKEVQRSGPVTVFNVFGNITRMPDFASTDEEILEYIYSIKDALKNSIQDAPEHISLIEEKLEGKDLLLIGCNFPDWLYRFVIRSMSDRFNNSATSKIIADRSAYDNKKLRSFLLHYNARVVPIGEHAQGEISFRNTADFVQELYDRWFILQDSVTKRYDGSVFISYASEDRETAKRVSEELTKEGVNVWYDDVSLKAGDMYNKKILNEIKECKIFIPIISNHAINRQDRYVYAREWRDAESRLKFFNDTGFIAPYIIDETSVTDERIPPFLRKLTIKPLNIENPGIFVDDITSRLSVIV